MDFFTLTTNELNNTLYGHIADGILIEKKSKFISYIFNIQNEDEAKEYINRIKKDNKEARHVVYIYSFIENNSINIKFSDDGEPQGTGTRAIYDMLQKESITNICVVIVRYFGGILLGTGPLSRAYLNSFKEAYLKCEKEEVHSYIEYSFYIDYTNLDNIKYIISTYTSKEAKIEDIKYNDNIVIKVKIIDKLLNDFKGKINRYIK